jgi:hypothetical protein
MQKNYYEDLFERFINLLVYLNTFDLFMTYFFVSNGICSESNPILVSLMVRYGYVAGVGLPKTFMSATLAMMLYKKDESTFTSMVLLSIPLSFYSTLFFYHCYIWVYSVMLMQL